MRREFQSPHVALEVFHLHLRQAKERSMIVDELANKRGGAAASFRLFLDHRSLLRGKPKGLREVVVSRRRLGHCVSSLIGVVVL